MMKEKVLESINKREQRAIKIYNILKDYKGSNKQYLGIIREELIKTNLELKQLDELLRYL